MSCATENTQSSIALNYDVHTFVFDKNRLSDAKTQQLKLLEEAAEAVNAARVFDGASTDDPQYNVKKMALEDEIADVISAACNLAAYAGLTESDINQTLDQNYKKCVQKGYVRLSDAE